MEEVDVLTREELLKEGLVNKFIRYARVNTQSEDSSKVPSSQGQLELARMLRDELSTMGLPDAAIDESGFVTATFPASPGVKGTVAGFLAHLDTVPGVPGKGVKPMVHRGYGGGDIVLPHGVVAVAENPGLQNVIGHDIITSDGTTLLGSDDKAGVAEIMEALCRMIQNPSLVHGIVKVAFTPDEETGQGIEHFNVERFGADVAYTLDGTQAGEMEYENFNAENLVVTIKGVSTHTGTARGAMVNAVHLAGELIGSIPAGMRPETTDGYQGFIHPDSLEGNVEQVRIKFLLRDFDDAGIEEKKRLMKTMVNTLKARHPACIIGIKTSGSYRNMRKVIEKSPRVVELARQAMEQAGLSMRVKPIRGGTDGARLSYRGLPCPNLFTGGMNLHSRTEWASAQWMEQAVQVVLNLAALWAKEKK